MALTLLTDVIVPEIFNPYVIERTATLSALRQSGILAPVEGITVPASGRTINMPFWQDLSGNSQVLPSNGTSALSTAKIEAGQDVAVILRRGNAWSDNDLAGALAGSDPMTAIGDLVAEWWARDDQTTALSVLKGVFAAPSMAGNVHDISALSGTDAVFSAESFIDASFKLGDAADRLTAVAVHSATYALMLKSDLIDFVPDSAGRMNIPTYLGKRVIVDDGMPRTADGVYTTYLFGPGALGYAEGTPAVPTATFRQELEGNNVLVNRRYIVIHPRGVAWQSPTIAGESPTNAEMEESDAWERVYENKNVRVVKFVHRIAAAAGS